MDQDGIKGQVKRTVLQFLYIIVYLHLENAPLKKNDITMTKKIFIAMTYLVLTLLIACKEDKVIEEEQYIPVMQVETISTKLISWLSGIGVFVTVISSIPLLLRNRRFNIELKLISSQPPTIIKATQQNQKLITVDITLYNLKLLRPEISSLITCQIGQKKIVPMKIINNENKELKFPLGVERSITLTLYFNYENCIQHFVNSDKFIVKLRDEFCNKTFIGKFKFNFVVPSDNEENNKDNT